MMKVVAIVAAITPAALGAQSPVIGLAISPLGCPLMATYMPNCVDHFGISGTDGVWQGLEGNMLVYDNGQFICCEETDFKEGVCNKVKDQGKADEVGVCVVSDQWCPIMQSTETCPGEYEQVGVGLWKTTDGKTMHANREEDGTLSVTCSGKTEKTPACLNPLFPNGVLYGMNVVDLSAVVPGLPDIRIYIPKLGEDLQTYPLTNGTEQVRLGGKDGTDISATDAAAYPALSTMMVEVPLTDTSKQQGAVYVYNHDRLVDLAEDEKVVIAGSMMNSCPECSAIQVSNASYAAFKVRLGVCDAAGSALKADLRFLLAVEGSKTGGGLHIDARVVPVATGPTGTDSTATMLYTDTFTTVPAVLAQAVDVAQPILSTNTDIDLVIAQTTESSVTQTVVALKRNATLKDYTGYVHIIALSGAAAQFHIPFFNSSTMFVTPTSNAGLGQSAADDYYTGAALTATPFYMAAMQGERRPSTDVQAMFARVDQSTAASSTYTIGKACTTTDPNPTFTEHMATFGIGPVANVEACDGVKCDAASMTGQCVGAAAGYECVCKPHYSHKNNDLKTCQYSTTGVPGAAHMTVGGVTTALLLAVALITL